jgi:hypothetical protein
MHPSIKRAREILARGDQQRVDYEAWQAEHVDELRDIKIDRLLEQQQQQQQRMRDAVVYRTTVNPPLYDETEQTTSTRYVTEHTFDHVINGICDEVGRLLGTAEKEIYGELAKLRTELAELRGQSNYKGSTVLDLPDFRKRHNNG